MAPPDDHDAGSTAQPGPYRVLARRYRPATFRDLIGQDALVRTVTNALDQGRMPQAFMLTGVRGVGKTTTARIIARALNCVGPDGAGGPTTEPCGECEHCAGIARDRHLDVIEMDAASRPGVNDIRDIIDGVTYRPVSARRKIYIVDEVHMLSTQAFNALLKTLEEPPEHVTFIFATTEIRKVPVTVLSRCMRFDLRRVDHATLVEHLRWIAGREGIGTEDEALGMMARAADGSVRDALSLMDQAVALDRGTITAAHVKEMLGLADRGRLYDLYDAVLGGRVQEALTVLTELYDVGADPGMVIQDLLTITHTLTRLQLAGDSDVLAGLPETERTRGRAMADALRPAQLTRNWQILLKGLQELQTAPEPRQAAEMVLIRLMHAAELPPPGDLVRALQGGGGGDGNAGSAPPQSGGSGGGAQAHGSAAVAQHTPSSTTSGAAPHASAPAAGRGPGPQPASLDDVVALCRERREARLAAELRQHARIVRFEPGLIEFSTDPGAPGDLANRLKQVLNTHTDRQWVVSLTDAEGAPTAREREAEAARAAQEAALNDPNVRAVLSAFPGAELIPPAGPGGNGGESR